MRPARLLPDCPHGSAFESREPRHAARLQTASVIAVTKAEQNIIDTARQCQHLEQLAHLRGREELLHRGRFAQIRRRRRIARLCEQTEQLRN